MKHQNESTDMSVGGQELIEQMVIENCVFLVENQGKIMHQIDINYILLDKSRNIYINKKFFLIMSFKIMSKKVNDTRWI